MDDGAFVKKLLTIKYKWLLLICGAMLFNYNNASGEITLEEFVPPNSDSMQAFDHLSTGFPLTGYHDLLECEACHAGGVYEKLPTRCNYCHNNAVAQGMSPGHVTVSGPCDICHTTLGFIENLEMDHRAVQGSCHVCHNGRSLGGKPATHVRSSDICDACHNTVYWSPVIRVDHNHLLSNCARCHDVPLQHPRSTGFCENCHSISQWSDLNIRHDQFIGPCIDCHQSDIPSSHARFSHDCGVCHFDHTNWVAIVKMNHAAVNQQCSGCHSINHGHIPVTNDCSHCHTLDSFYKVDINHNDLGIQQCILCHNGQVVHGKPAKHCITSAPCRTCHVTADWENARDC